MDLKSLLIYRLHEDDEINELRYNDLLEKYEGTDDSIREVWTNIIQANSTKGYERWFFEEDLKDFNETFANVKVYAKTYSCMAAIFTLIIRHCIKTGIWQ